jgi:hypothetical protein
MCHDVPFLEVHENHFVVIAPPPESTHYTNQMNCILNTVMPLGRKGSRQYFSVQRKQNDRLNMRVCCWNGNSAHKFLDHCIVNTQGEMIYSDFDKVKVEVDKEKTLAMNKKIRNYFKPYEVIVRLQSVEEQIKEITSKTHGINLSTFYARLNENIPEGVIAPQLYDKINEHIASGKTMTTEFTTLMVQTCCPYGYRYKNYREFLAKVRKTKALLRLRFTQGCTKVMYDKYIPEEAYAKHQSMVIQQIDGLRSLQVPSPTQVSGQSPGAVPPVA